MVVQVYKIGTLADVSKVKITAFIYSKSHKVATQANVRKARGMQMGSALLDIYVLNLNFDL